MNMSRSKKVRKQEKLVNAQLQFQSIELLSGSINAPHSLNPTSDYNFNINIQTQADESKALIFSIVYVDITNPERTFTYGSLVASCIYALGNFNEIITKDEMGRHIIPKGLADTLNMISISTTRGIMFSTFKGTFLHNAIMPLVNPQQIVSHSAQQQL